MLYHSLRSQFAWKILLVPRLGKTLELGTDLLNSSSTLPEKIQVSKACKLNRPRPSVDESPYLFVRRHPNIDLREWARGLSWLFRVAQTVASACQHIVEFFDATQRSESKIRNSREERSVWH